MAAGQREAVDEGCGGGEAGIVAVVDGTVGDSNHSLRTTFGTHLSTGGVPLRTAQAAMRRSDPRLTANV